MKIKEIPKDAVLITGSLDYIDSKGNVYSYDTRNNKKIPIMKEQRKCYGYKYCGIKYIKNGKTKVITKRVHRLVAEMFIPNPNNYPIVMHIDNNKSNNIISNLKWGTISENTKQAFNDGLIINKKGFEDNQSIPCKCFYTTTNKLYKIFGSVHEASREMNIGISTILNQLKNNYEKFKKDFYFTYDNEPAKSHYIIIQYDYKTDKEKNRFSNSRKASDATGILASTILEQIRKNKKPKYDCSGSYFLKVLLKSEETIENNK